MSCASASPCLDATGGMDLLFTPVRDWQSVNYSVRRIPKHLTERSPICLLELALARRSSCVWAVYGAFVYPATRSLSGPIRLWSERAHIPDTIPCPRSNPKPAHLLRIFDTATSPRAYSSHYAFSVQRKCPASDRVWWILCCVSALLPPSGTPRDGCQDHPAGPARQ